MKWHKIIILLLGIMCLSGCLEGADIQYLGINSTTKKKIPSYEEFTRNRKECKQLAEGFCSYPLTSYCTLDAYEKRMVFIKNCMHQRGWNDPYNMYSYYK